MKKQKFKVYFEGSLAGRNDYGDYYREIIDVLEKNGCSVTQTVLTASKKEEEESISPERSREIYRRVLKSIANNDFMVAEMTFGSPSIAALIKDAMLSYKKPVLMLVHESKTKRRGVPFTGNTSKLLTLKKYSVNNLDSVVKDFLKKAQKSIPSTRFTTRLNGEVDDYIEYMKLKLKVSSKSQTVLELLDQLMDSDDDYQKFKEED